MPKTIVDAATALQSFSETVSAPVFLQEQYYGSIIAKTLDEINEYNNRPKKALSFTEKMLGSVSEMNKSSMSAELSAIFDAKGSVVNNCT